MRPKQSATANWLSVGRRYTGPGSCVQTSWPVPRSSLSSSCPLLVGIFSVDEPFTLQMRSMVGLSAECCYLTLTKKTAQLSKAAIYHQTSTSCGKCGRVRECAECSYKACSGAYVRRGLQPEVRCPPV